MIRLKSVLRIRWGTDTITCSEQQDQHVQCHKGTEPGLKAMILDIHTDDLLCAVSLTDGCEILHEDSVKAV